MADHNVTLMYSANGDFEADPQTIRVRPGETIAFQLASGSVAGTIRITFRDRHFFTSGNPNFGQTGVFHHGDGDVRVVAALSGRTTYRCELLDANGNVIAQSHENAGGDIIPANLA